jgi:hypothetical protein
MQIYVSVVHGAVTKPAQVGLDSSFCQTGSAVECFVEGALGVLGDLVVSGALVSSDALIVLGALVVSAVG